MPLIQTVCSDLIYQHRSLPGKKFHPAPPCTGPYAAQLAALASNSGQKFAPGLTVAPIAGYQHRPLPGKKFHTATTRAGPYAAQLAAPASKSGQKFIPDLNGLLRSHLPAQIATCVAADPKLTLLAMKIARL